MKERWVISDTHFSHSNILTFIDNSNKPVRSFSSVEEMDETMIQNWNKVVKQDDVVYHLGDVTMKKQFLPILNRLNGSKRLILGNHDLFHEEYPKYFKRVYAMRIFPKKAILTHVPIHPDSLGRWKFCLHGHIHTEFVKHSHLSGLEPMNDERYLNCCVEVNNYQPINLDQILSKAV